MVALLASPDPKTVALLDAVVIGFRLANGEWPIWQYIDLLLAKGDVDGEAAYIGLKSWEHRYRSIWSNGSGAIPSPDEVIALTIHGIHHGNHGAAIDLSPPGTPFESFSSAPPGVGRIA